MNAPARYVVICFRGDEAYRWKATPNLRDALSACDGIALCNLDDYTGYVYDLDSGRLLFDADEIPPEFMREKCASADAKMEKFINERRGAQ